MNKSTGVLSVLGLLLVGTNLCHAQGPVVAAKEQKLRAKLKEHTGGAYCLAFSPDGKVLATGGRDRTVRLWDVATGKVMATLEGHEGSVWAVAISPDGKTLVAGSGRYDPQRKRWVLGELRVWDVAHRKVKESLAGHREQVNDVAFSPDGKLLASASDDGTVKLWEVGDRGLKLRQAVYDASAPPPGLRKPPPRDAVCSVAFSPDGKLLAWGENDHVITIWNMAAAQVKARLEGHAGSIRSVAFSPDGKTLASAGHDDTTGGVSIKLWVVSTAKELDSFNFAYKRSSGIFSVAFDQTGRTLVSGSNDGVVKLWDWAVGKNKTILEEKNIAVYKLKFSPDGATLAGVRSDGSLVLWNAALLTGANR